jgi:chemotaxis protein CheX
MKELRNALIRELLAAVVNVLEMMAEMELRPGRPRLVSHDAARADITGVMGLAGPHEVSGSFAICFDMPCIGNVVEALFGEVPEDLAKECQDAVGEITNMVSGAARAALETQGHHFDMAIPTVIAAPSHKVSLMTQGPIVQIPFETPGGPFFVQCALWQG